MSRPILVTGAAGAVGRTVCELLIDQGHRVRAMVRTEDERSARLAACGVEIVVGDLTDLDAAHRAIDGCDRVDFELGYRRQVGGGALSLRGLAAYTIRQNTQGLPGSPLIRWAGVGGYPPATGGLGVPKLKITAIAQYVMDTFGVTMQERWRSGVKLNGDPTLVFSDTPLPPIAYTDVTFSFTPPGARRFEFFASVENLFNKQPKPFMVSAYSSVPGFAYSAPQGDDIVGRYFTAGVRIRL